MAHRINLIVSVFFLFFASVAYSSTDDLFYRYNVERAEFQSDRRSFGKDALEKKVHQKNLDALASLKTDTELRRTKRIQLVPHDLARQIYRSVANNPVASLSRYDKYDPQDKGIGFCFGRAMNVHLESLFQGIAKESIMKLWALGNLESGATSWRYHVTAVLRGEKDWLAIDPITGGVVTVEEWYHWMKSNFDSDGEMRLYVTAPAKFGPSSSKYHNSEILDPFYNDFFRDLLAYYAHQTGNGR